ncbi:hypothetical protein N310_13592, partial [Acanthisitta chloris]
SSTNDKEPPAHQLLRASSPEHCLPVLSFPSSLPCLDQVLPSSGYLPYYRTEGEICTGPAQWNGSLTGIDLETKEGYQRGGTDIWSLGVRCLM